MGAGADAQIIPAPPVDQVVPALGAVGGMVRHFIGRHAVGLADLLRHVVEVGGEILVGQVSQAAGGVAGAEGGAGFDGQLVERQVVDRHRQGLGQLAAPAGDVLTLAGIDQVEADPGECFTCNIEGAARLRGAVQSPQAPQRSIIKRLYSHGNPVHPASAEGAEPARLDRGRVGLKGDLEIIGDRPQPADLVDHGRHGVGIHQAGRAAAEEHAAQHPARGQSGAAAQFRQIGAPPAVMVDRGGDMRVEVAIGAFGGAERPVQVQAEAARLPVCRLSQATRP